MCASRDSICRYEGRKRDVDEFHGAYEVKTRKIRDGGV